jgi:hypothetical protein
MSKLPSLPALLISPEKAYFIVAKARQFDAKDGLTDPESGSNASDDAMRSVLEDRTDDPVLTELTSFIHDLNDDEQIDLVALSWLGRGDGDIENWDELRAEAARAHNKRTAAYLLGMPMLADHLEDALSKFGHSSEEVGADIFRQVNPRRGNPCRTATISIFLHRFATTFRRMRRISIGPRSTMPSQPTRVTFGRKRSLTASLGQQSSDPTSRMASIGYRSNRNGSQPVAWIQGIEAGRLGGKRFRMATTS